MNAYEEKGKWKYGLKGEAIYDSKQEALNNGWSNRLKTLRKAITKISKQRNK